MASYNFDSGNIKKLTHVSHLTTMTASSLFFFLKKKEHCQLIEKRRKKNKSRVYRSVGFDRSVELHGSSTLLDNFSILSVQPSLLVFLHPSNFFLKSGSKNIKHQCSLEWKTKVPLLGSFIFVGVACWG